MLFIKYNGFEEQPNNIAYGRKSNGCRISNEDIRNGDLCTYVNNVDTFILSIMKFFSNIL